MIRLFHDPFAIAILAGTLISLATARTRFASVSILSALFVLLTSAELACFDGRRHLTEKFDATFFVWGRAVELRALGGLAVLLVAAPVGAASAKLARLTHGSLIGLAILGPFGLGLFASSIRLQLAARTIMAHEDPAERLVYLHTAINQSSWVLAIGTLASLAACAGVIIRGSETLGFWIRRSR